VYQLALSIPFIDIRDFADKIKNTAENIEENTN